MWEVALKCPGGKGPGRATMRGETRSEEVLPMMVIGLLLAAAAAAFTALLIAFNTSGGPEYTVSLFGSDPFTISTLGAFAGGLGLALVFALGMWLMREGLGLHHRHAVQRKEGGAAVGERDRLRRQLDAEHRTGGTGASTGAARSEGADASGDAGREAPRPLQTSGHHGRRRMHLHGSH